MELKIKRVAIIDDGAFGVFLQNGIPFAVTLERTYPVQDLIGQYVKIAPGIYRCTRSQYYRGGYPTFEIHVPGHTRILFHKGNLEKHFDGCVGVAEEFGVMEGKPAILQSGTHPHKGFNEFMELTKGLDYFDLIVEDVSN